MQIPNEIARVNCLHESIAAALRKTTQDAIEAGKILSGIRGSCKQGEWEVLFAKPSKFSFCLTTAKNYMRLAKEAEKSATVADLSLTDAYRASGVKATDKPSLRDQLGITAAQITEAFAAAPQPTATAIQSSEKEFIVAGRASNVAGLVALVTADVGKLSRFLDGSKAVQIRIVREAASWN